MMRRFYRPSIRSSTPCAVVTTALCAYHQTLCRHSSRNSRDPSSTLSPSSTEGRKSPVSASRVADNTVVEKAKHPLEILNELFQKHPAALKLHRELTISLANGDAAQAADLAAVLAGRVKRFQQEQVENAKDTATSSLEGGSPTAPKVTDKSPDLPRGIVHDDMIESALDKTADFVAASSPVSSSSAAVSNQEATATRSAPFWKSPDALCLTILETEFEAVLPDPAAAAADDELNPLTDAGRRAQEEEEEQVRILNRYLEAEAARWRNQKDAIGKVVLDTVKSLGLCPEDLQSTESAAAATGDAINVMRHCNLVVRGEVPDVFGAGTPVSADAAAVREKINQELRNLEAHLQRSGSVLSSEDRKLAAYELMLSHTAMRYVVGLHHDLQLSFETSPHVSAALAATRTKGSTIDPSTITQVCIDRIVERLNRAPPQTRTNQCAEDTLSASEAQLLERLSTPVLPFTFMLKCCLWFDVPR